MLLDLWGNTLRSVASGEETAVEQQMKNSKELVGKHALKFFLCTKDFSSETEMAFGFRSTQQNYATPRTRWDTGEPMQETRYIRDSAFGLLQMVKAVSAPARLWFDRQMPGIYANFEGA